ncbi:ankyrin repeat-containing domain protein [Aspergillus oleicola]
MFDRDPNDRTQNDFIEAARANDVDRLEYLMDIQELQSPMVRSYWPRGFHTPRVLAAVEAGSRNHPEALSLLWQREGGGRECLYSVLFAKSKECVDALLALGWKINQMFDHNSDPLSFCLGGDPDFFDFLLSRGADPNLSGEWHVTRCAIERAAAFQPISMIEKLLKAGGDPMTRDVLANAAKEGRLEVLSWLLDYGVPIDHIADSPDTLPDVREQELRNALQTAAFWGQPAAVEFLLSRGADPTIRDSGGRTAFELAQMEGHLSCVDILSRYGHG